MRIQLILLYTVFSVLIFQGCKTLSTTGILNAVEKPKIESISPRITGLDFQGIDLAFDVKILNPYRVPIRSPRFKYGLDIENASFLNSETTSKLDLPARGSGTVELPVRLKYLDLWNTYQRLKGASEVPYTLRGAMIFTAARKEIELPIQKSGSFPILRVPQFSAVDVETPEVSFGGVKVGVKANVGNPNVFALGLQNLGYDLQIGNIKVGSLQTQTLKAIGAGENQEVSFTGAVSGMDAIKQLLAGEKIGNVKILPRGSISTPYGNVRLPE